MSENLSDYITDIRNAISERVFQNEEDKRTGFLGLFRRKCSGGVCLFQDPKYAECCAGVIRLLGIEYKILLMCRVNPAKIRQPSEHDKFWVLNPTPDEIRPYRILLKRIDNSPLSLDNKLKIEYSPVYYIVNAINSNDCSFYDLKKNRLSEYNPTEIIDEEFQNQIFVIKVYSSIYYKPINTYMYKREILKNFPDADKTIVLPGFSKKQLNSAICCIQKAIKNKSNVDNNTFVYRGTAFKFPDNINVGSQFYFSSFISTSKDKNVAESFLSYQKGHQNYNGGTLMKIIIQNNGTDNEHPYYCFNIENYSISPEQKEVLICSHCYFQVLKITRSTPDDYVELVCKGYLLDNFNISNKDNNGDY